jgi:hypothetical protein
MFTGKGDRYRSCTKIDPPPQISCRYAAGSRHGSTLHIGVLRSSLVSKTLWTSRRVFRPSTGRNTPLFMFRPSYHLLLDTDTIQVFGTPPPIIFQQISIAADMPWNLSRFPCRSDWTQIFISAIAEETVKSMRRLFERKRA